MSNPARTRSTPFLRYAGEDPDPARGALADTLAALEAGPTDDVERLRLTGRVGECYRMLRQEEDALPFLEAALALALRRVKGDRALLASTEEAHAAAQALIGRHPAY